MPVQLEQSWPAPTAITAVSEDFSIHGMRLVVPSELWIGACVRIACEFCDAVGEVTNAQPAPDAGPRPGASASGSSRSVSVSRAAASCH
jgi:hypothetical protein